MGESSKFFLCFINSCQPSSFHNTHRPHYHLGKNPRPADYTDLHLLMRFQGNEKESFYEFVKVWITQETGSVLRTSQITFLIFTINSQIQCSLAFDKRGKQDSEHLGYSCKLSQRSSGTARIPTPPSGFKAHVLFTVPCGQAIH